MNKTTRVITVLLPTDEDGDRMEGAEVLLDGEQVMGGQEHDFYPGCHGITEYGYFKGPESLATAIECTLLKQGYDVRVETPECHYDNETFYNIVLGKCPPRVVEPEVVIPKTVLKKDLIKRLHALDDALGNVDRFSIRASEDLILEVADPAVEEAWADFAEGIDWRKYHFFLQALRLHTNFEPR